ncbi:MAG: NAD(+) synthase [Candidatus Gastranaerophilales bacterium]|nr:NAD(+) synthase [Candidatus Gastranaerophilales bacterium]
MKTAIIQFNPKTADIEENADRITSYIANEKEADVIIFPSLAVTGINCRDYFLSADFIERQNNALEEIKELSVNSRDIIIGFAEKCKDGLYSSVALFSNGEEKILCRKKELSNAEAKYFKSGNGAVNIEYKGRLMTVSLDKEKTCNTDTLLNMALENFQTDTINKRLKQKNYQEIRVNPVCYSGTYLYDGRSYFSNKKGEKLVEAKAFCEDRIFLDDTKSYSPLPITEVNKYDETIDGIVFALKDFCSKTGFKKIVLGLSGGIDSALTAVFACKAIGADNVLGITMPSEYSSSGSVDDSYELAKNLGMECITKPIKPLFNCFVDEVQNQKYNDLAEENLQSRLRGVILMNYSNRYNALLLSTGNKSEVATGYCTLYGDTCGGLCLLSDIYKTDVYKLSERINKDKVVIPISTMTKAPSAELRPNQKDTDSLPDYEVLDKVIKLYFEENLPREEIKYLCPNQPVEQIINTILRAEFKRKQMTLGIKLSERSFVSDIDYPTI